MDDNQNPSPSETAIDVLANQYYTLASVVILYYDYALTFSMEVDRFWSQRTFSWVLFFFYLNRYLSLLGHVPVIIYAFLQSLSNDHNACRPFQAYHQYFAMVSQLIVAILVIMRIYALYNQSCRVLSFLIGLTACVVAFGCWSIVAGKAHTLPVSSEVCSTVSKSEAIHFAAGWGGVLVLDFMVFGMTVVKAISVVRTRDRPLINVLLRDGSMYFLILGLANLSNILTFVLGGPLVRGIGTTFMNVISSVMISRLMLNLRSPSLAQRETPSSSGTDTNTTNQPCILTVVDGPCDSNLDMQIRFPDPIITMYSSNDEGESSGVETVPRTLSNDHTA